MKIKHTGFLFVFLLTLSFATMRVKSAEPPVAAEGNYGWLSWEVRAPKEITLGEEYSVIFSFEPMVTLDVDHINVSVYGTIGSEGAWDKWEDSWSNRQMHWETTYTKSEYFTAAKEGGVWGEILAVYDDTWGERHTQTTQFYIADIRSKTHQELQSDTNLLNQSYQTLQNNYDSLEVTLNNTTMWMGAFLITSVAFIATTIYFAMRKPRTKTS